MPVLAKFLYFVKIVASFAVISTAGWIASKVLVFKHVAIPSEQQYYKDQGNSINVNEILWSGYSECLKSPSKLICIVAANHQLHVIEKGVGMNLDRDYMSNTDDGSKKHHHKIQHPVSTVVSDFILAMAQMDVEAILLEPSILYCMLTDDLKVLLLKRRCDMRSILGAANVVNFGILKRDVDKMNSSMTVLEKFHFKNYEVDSSAEDQKNWMSDEENISVHPFHHFFVRRNIVIHVVVMFDRRGYLWIPKLTSIPNELQNLVKMDKLLYAVDDFAFERFSPIAIKSDADIIFIPSDPVSFLLQVSSAKFLECESRRHVGLSNEKKTPLVPQSFRESFLISADELNRHLQPMLINFFLWGRTLLDWYRECDITSSPSIIDYATWEIDSKASEKLSEHLNKHQLEYFKFGLEEEVKQLNINIKNVQIQLLFISKGPDDNVYHAIRQTDGYHTYTRKTFPRFDVCSTEFLGQLVRVPCDYEEVLKAEFGPDLERPVFNYGDFINNSDIIS